MTLHEAIAKLLRQKGPMTVTEITDELNRNKWYEKNGGSLLDENQVRGRIGNPRYAGMFNRDGGAISLKEQPTMKNFPHQFNNLEKLYDALAIAKQLTENNQALTDRNYGEALTRAKIYTYRDKTLSVDDFLEKEQQKTPSNRGSHTVARDIRRLFELMNFINISSDKKATFNPIAEQFLQSKLPEERHVIWRNSMFDLTLKDADNNASHPYRILLKLVNNFPGIETKKLMLALAAKDDSDKEFERISKLSELDIEEIIEKIGTSKSMAANAVKVLPGIAEQLDDIVRISNRAYPVSKIIITEDEILTEGLTEKQRSTHRKVTAAEIAKDPIFKVTSSLNIDITDAIKKRQERLAEHQEIVRLLALLHEKCGFQLFEGKFDCLAVKGDLALLYEVKTILENAYDQEKQTVKGFGQLKYYRFSIVEKEMGLSNIRELLVFSRKPRINIIEFCVAENIAVIWRTGNTFQIYNIQNKRDETFNPDEL